MYRLHIDHQMDRFHDQKAKGQRGNLLDFLSELPIKVSFKGIKSSRKLP